MYLNNNWFNMIDCTLLNYSGISMTFIWRVVFTIHEYVMADEVYLYCDRVDYVVYKHINWQSNLMSVWVAQKMKIRHEEQQTKLEALTSMSVLFYLIVYIQPSFLLFLVHQPLHKNVYDVLIHDDCINPFMETSLMKIGQEIISFSLNLK